MKNSTLEYYDQNAEQFFKTTADVDFTGIKTIENEGFWGTGFTELNLTGVTTLKNSAFASCNNLTEVTLSNVTSFGSMSFSTCGKLETVTIGVGVTQIGDYAFKDCSALTRVTFVEADGWSYTPFGGSPTSVNVSYPETNATNLKSSDGVWYSVILNRTE